MTDCIFCDPADRLSAVQTLDGAYLRRDRYPVAEGHMEAVPLRHVESFFDLTAEELCDIADLLHHARDLTPADGYTIGVNEGRAAGRTVDHLHVHLIPRRHGDVVDPRGGVRNVLPGGPNPDLWQAATHSGSYGSEAKP